MSLGYSGIMLNSGMGLMGKREGFEHLSVEIDHFLDKTDDGPPSAMSTCSDTSVDLSDSDSNDDVPTLSRVDWQPVRERRMSYDFFAFPSDYEPTSGALDCSLPSGMVQHMNSKSLQRPDALPQKPPKVSTEGKKAVVSPPRPIDPSPGMDSEDESQPEDRNRKIGIYTREERKARIRKFHEKRKRRIWKKRIKYDCRKKLADDRPRIKGRFVTRVKREEGASILEDMHRALQLDQTLHLDSLGISTSI